MNELVENSIEKKLSIIVPVYGVEDYILEFLESIVPQLRDSIELILINDGAEDRSMDICSEYLNGNYSNIIVLNQVNQGQSIARNYGISVSKGEYIAFLDPDDYVATDYIEEILKAIKMYRPDIIDFKAVTFSEIDNNQSIIMNQSLRSGYYDGKEKKELLKKIFTESVWQSWLRVVKREIMVKYKYPVGVLIQDAYIFPYIYIEAKNILHVDKVLVNYRVRGNSAVNTINEKQLHSYKKLLRHLDSNRCDLIDITVKKLCVNYIYLILKIHGVKGLIRLKGFSEIIYLFYFINNYVKKRVIK